VSAAVATLDPAAEDTWLVDHAVRHRLQEDDGNVRRARWMAFALQAVAVAACLPQLGLIPALTLPTVVGAFALADRVVASAHRPELVYGAAWSFAQAVLALTAALTGGVESPILMWLGVPIATGVGRFTPRGLAAAVGLTLGLMLAATLGVDPQDVYAAPQLLAFPASLVVGIALVGSALMRSEVEHRADAIVDPLTQMLNRKALAARGRELALQSAVSGRPVGLLLGDIDHFKRINDTDGHQAGDAVLREIAYRWRSALRAYDLAYRLGGEEFVVLVPGATPVEAASVAERLREAIRSEPIAGHAVTMSFGVALSGAGGFDLDAQYARADTALYAAKRGGRDQVCVADGS
jgi:diguanylate cyclase (GGDEF)-like protein